jgi:hypothetical protein
MELDVSNLPEVVVNFNDAEEFVLLGVHSPLGLPLASPESVQFDVDARYVYLQKTFDEAQTCATAILFVDPFDVFLNSLSNRILVLGPTFVDLFWCVFRISLHLCRQSQRVETEFALMLRIVVDKLISLAIIFDWALNVGLAHHDSSSVVKLNLLTMSLVILL